MNVSKKYTDRQLKNALILAAHGREGIDLYSDHTAYKEWSPRELTELRAILEALPVTDRGKPIPVIDVRVGDRIVLDDVAGDTHDVVVTRTKGRLIEWGHGLIFHSNIVSVHLLDRPVTHPDPTEHPLITVNVFDGDDMAPGSYARAARNAVGEAVYEVVYGDGDGLDETCITTAEAITDWVPAKVVADEGH